MSDPERRVRDALRARPDAGERRAQDRAWAVVRAAGPAARPARRRRAATLAPAAAGLVLLAAVLALALTPPGDAVADLLRRAIGAPAAEPAPPPRPMAADRLPGGGALLASSRRGPVVVTGATATDRLLGAVDEASWSPRGRFVVAARGPEVIAVDRSGRRRWSVAAPARVRHPRWSPDGFRVAYLAGGRLRVVAGDGTGDRAVGPPVHVGAVAPAWRPGTAPGRHVIALAGRDGRVEVRDADTGRRPGVSRSRLRARALAWTPDGSRLLVTGATSTAWLTPGGTLINRVLAPDRRQLTAIAAAPRGRDYAVITRTYEGRSEVFVVRRGRSRFLLGVPGRMRGLAWSPDGRWLAVGSPAADAWLLLRPGARGLTGQRTVEQIRRRLGGGGAVRLEGWCCRR